MKAALRLVLTLGAVITVPACLVEQSATVGETGQTLTASLPAAPEFDLVSLGGGTISSADLRGKVVVLDFWATWCPPCIEEIPNYNALHAEQDGDEFFLLGITAESGNIEDVRPYIPEYGIRYPVVMADADVVSGFGGINAWPMTFVISPDWKIFRKYIGQYPPDKKEQIERDVSELRTAFPGR